MGWVWYLGCDFVFFIITAILLPLLYLRRNLGMSIITVVMLTSMSISMYYITHWDLNIYMFGGKFSKYSSLLYGKPYIRIPAYLVGVLFGVFYNEKQKQKTLRQQPQQQYQQLGQEQEQKEQSQRRIESNSNPQRVRENSSTYSWLDSTNWTTLIHSITLGLMVFIVLIPITDYNTDGDWTTFESAVYLTFSRPLWTFLLAILCFIWFEGTKTGLNGAVSYFLSLYFFVPLARLTYGAYLWHPIVMMVIAGSRNSYYHFDGIDLIGRTFINSTFAYLASAITFFLLERPLLNIVSRCM